jgi:acyl-CoA reductase-like NAD-dependent aldehyde dehydrogenase
MAHDFFTESGNTGAPYLVASPDVQVISYTGSTTVGRLVAADGPLAITDFQEAKTVVHSVPALQD